MAITLLERLWKSVLKLVDRQVGAAEQRMAKARKELEEEIINCSAKVKREAEIFDEKQRRSEETYEFNLEELRRQIKIVRNDKLFTEELLRTKETDLKAAETEAENLREELAVGGSRRRGRK